MNVSKNFNMIFLTFSVIIFHGIPCSSLVYSPVQRFWTRSLRGIDYTNTFEKFLNEYQTTSRSLQPSANENSYGKWWFLQNSVPFPIVPTENIIVATTSTEKSKDTTDAIENYMNLIRDYQMLVRIPPIFQNKDENLSRNRWKNIVLQV